MGSTTTPTPCAGCGTAPRHGAGNRHEVLEHDSSLTQYRLCSECSHKTLEIDPSGTQAIPRDQWDTLFPGPSTENVRNGVRNFAELVHHAHVLYESRPRHKDSLTKRQLNRFLAPIMGWTVDDRFDSLNNWLDDARPWLDPCCQKFRGTSG